MSASGTQRSRQDECVYCGGIATTRDHVPPKLLLEKPFPADLGTVPCCKKCNQGFSLDEQYFLILLGQIATSLHVSESSQIGLKISKTLGRSPKLNRRIYQSLEVDQETGIIGIKPELERVRKIITKTAIGLYVLRYSHIPTKDLVSFAGAYPYNVSESRPVPYFISTFTDKFRNKKWVEIQKGVFSYIFVHDPMTRRRYWCVMDFYQCLWGVVHLPHPSHTGSGLRTKNGKGQQSLAFEYCNMTNYRRASNKSLKPTP